jgi:hypothetical protein
MAAKSNQSILHRIYNAASALPVMGSFLKNWRINRHYDVERRVLKGKHQNDCPHRSIMFFTVYKAASSFIGAFMNKIVAEAGMTAVNLDGYFFDRGQGREWEGTGRVIYDVSYSPTGYFYGPFRSFNKAVPDIDQYKILLVLRDPRDVIVSSYYSLYSHVSPQALDKEQLVQRHQRRKKKAELTVDEYVIDKINSTSRLTDDLMEYHQQLSGKDNVLFLKYEDMVTDFEPWLNQLLTFLDLDISPELKNEISDSGNFKVDKENVYKHKRQVTPGDYKRKLKPETIERLNIYMKNVLNLYGYSLDS